MSVPVKIETDEERQQHAHDTRRRNGIGVFISLLLIAAISVVILKYGGSDATQEIIAFFTFIAAVATGLQWMTMVDQNLHMREQTVILVKQNEHMAKQTESMIVQTDALKIQIEDAKYDRRPWLTASRITAHQELLIDRLYEYSIPFANSGDSPATIKFAAAKMATESRNEMNLWPQVQSIWNKALRSEMEVVIGKDSCDYAFIPDAFPKFSRETVKGIEEGELILYVFGACQYTGAEGGDFALQYCFAYDRFHKTFLMHKQHNCVDVPAVERGK